MSHRKDEVRTDCEVCYYVLLTDNLEFAAMCHLKLHSYFLSEDLEIRQFSEDFMEVRLISEKDLSSSVFKEES